MRLRQGSDFIRRVFLPLIHIIRNIAGSVIVAMMLLTVADVVSRYFFNSPILGAYELSNFMLVIAVFFSMVCCEFTKGHITIGLVVSRLGQRRQAVIDSIMYFLYLVTFCLLTWRLCVYAFSEIGGFLSRSLNIPVFPFVFIAALGSALLSLMVLMHFLIFLAEALRK